MRHLPVGHDEPLRAELIAFLHAVRSGGVPAVTGDEGVASLEIATRCLETPTKPAAASSTRKGPRRLVG
jgi:predicted dehydrogenase